MRPIQKRFQPKELISFQKLLANLSSEDSPTNTFEALKSDDLTVQAVQLSIAKEQGFICCYCMGRLKEYTDSYHRRRVHIEIEHYKPKSIFNGTINPSDKAKLLCDEAEKIRIDLRIDYKNLLGACGSDGHCGNAKGDSELCYIPNPSTTKPKEFLRLGYNFKGKIRSLSLDEEEKEKINKELVTKLNLNHQTLKGNRIGAWNGIKNYIKNQLKIKDLHEGGSQEIRLVEDLITKYSQRSTKDKKFFPYCDFIVHLLKSEYKNQL